MPGKAKRKYDGELMRFGKSLKRPLDKIFKILPQNYKAEDILNLFKEYYPYEWEIIYEGYQTYSDEDEFWSVVGKREDISR